MSLALSEEEFVWHQHKTRRALMSSNLTLFDLMKDAAFVFMHTIYEHVNHFAAN